MRLSRLWSLSLCLLASFAASPTFADELDYSVELPRIAPKSPVEALATFQVLPGFKIEQVAAEPLVRDPVAMSFDERGRLFVVEMCDYSEQDKDFLGNIRLLEDTNEDGRFDKATVYVDKLSWPTAVICYDGGVFVGAAPDIWYCKDADGDGVAEIRQKVFTGFGRGNVQGLINTFQWGLDNRIHGATSSTGAEVRPADKPDAKPLVLRGRDFAFDPRTLEMEATSGGAQHGLSFDDYGRKFVSSNSDHIQMVMFEDRYLARNKYLAAPSPRMSIAADGPQAEVFRISPVEPWRIVRTRLRVSGAVKGIVEGGGRAAGYFTGATGVTIYRGDAWPKEYVGQAFVGDVGSNIVHRKTLKPDGVGFIAERTDAGREFVASTDTWFRPCQFANAPDGNLYIADVYREVIEHPASIPPEIKKHLDLTSGRDRGRIYRVVPDDFTQRKLPRLDTATIAELVSLLDHPNGWTRDTAARLLFQRQDKSAVAPLKKLAREGLTPEGQVHAMHALAGLNAYDDRALAAAQLDAKNPRVREHAVRLAEPLLKQGKLSLEGLQRLIQDDDIRVRYQWAFTLGEIKSREARAALAGLAARDGDDKWLRLAVMSSLADGADEALGKLLADGAARNGPAARGMIGSMVQQIGARNRPAEVQAVLTGVAGLPAKEHALRLSMLRSLADGLSQVGSSLHAALGGEANGPTAKLLSQLLAESTKRSLDESQPPADRVNAAGGLSLGAFGEVQPTLARLLEPRQPQELQLAALAALGKFRDPQVAQPVLAVWQGMSPRVRAQAAELLFARPERLTALLDAASAGTVVAADLEPARIAALSHHPNAKLAARAKELFGAAKLSKRQDVLTAYKNVLQMDGSRERGQGVFRKTCAACHKMEGVGHEIGPNLATVQNRGADSILLNVLDPNREVNPQFVNYVLVTTDGRSLTGMIAAETSTGVTLKRAESQSDTVLRIHIEELASTRMSIMPEGMEKQIDRQAMADLIAYLTSVAPPTSTAQLAQAVKPPAPSGWKAGTAKVNITPEHFMWMSGYGARTAPADGKLTDLWAKALAIEDPQGKRLLLITLDLVGIDRQLSLAVRERIAQQNKLEIAGIAIGCSHTHTGPVTRETLGAMYFLDETQQKLVADYTDKLKVDLVTVAAAAVNGLQPAEISWGQGKSGFAVNRRNNKEPEVPKLLEAGTPLVGPVDHAVPVLRVQDAQGALKAVVFGYACHATVLSLNQWSGDYPGFAQLALEAKHPGCQAMFFAGCGADQNPLPRRTVELAKKYGDQLASAVEETLSGPLSPVSGTSDAKYAEIPLAFDKLPTRADLERDAQGADKYAARRAKLLLEKLDAGQSLSQMYPYPVQTWRLGNLHWITLGGEVVVDYSLRIKSELGDKTWIAGYTNDVMAYIPSRRVLIEGGYEGGGAMVYYGQPTIWSPEVEESILREVKRQAGK